MDILYKNWTARYSREEVEKDKHTVIHGGERTVNINSTPPSGSPTCGEGRRPEQEHRKAEITQCRQIDCRWR